MVLFVELVAADGSVPGHCGAGAVWSNRATTNPNATPAIPVSSNLQQIQPTVRINYYPMKRSEVEVEVGANFSKTHTVLATQNLNTNDRGLFLSAGYRLDF